MGAHHCAEHRAQAAHLFVTLLLSGGRSGEIATLKQNCVEIGRDGKNYLSGYTYKLAGNLFGDARTWPAPDILAQCLGHQARLAAAWNWLPSSYGEGLPQTPRFGDALWISIRVAGKFDKDLNLDINSALKSLARRLDMDPMPGGKNVHAHRFRKTIGRLAGVTLFNSPLVLKRIFGHKSIEMTLHYILCDPGVRKEAEMVLRELRIMHCAEALEEIHQAMRDGTALPDHGGPGAAA
jgi:integrase